MSLQCIRRWLRRAGPVSISVLPALSLARLSLTATASVVSPYSIALTELRIPVRASGVVSGPDGNMWFTGIDNNFIRRVKVAGAVDVFATPTSNSAPTGITLGAGREPVVHRTVRG
jgi:hypothetical protein